LIGENHILWGTASGHLLVKDLNDKLVAEYPGIHQNMIWGIQSFKNRIYTVSNNDPVVGIFEVNPDMSLRTVQLLKTEDNLVNMWVCSVSEKYIVTGDAAGTIYLWNHQTYVLEKKIKTNCGGLFSMGLVDDRILAGTTAGKFCVFDFDGEGKSVAMDINSENAIVRGVHDLGKGNVITGSGSGLIEEWDASSLTRLHTHRARVRESVLQELIVVNNHIIASGITPDSVWIDIFDRQTRSPISSITLPFPIQEGRVCSTNRIYSIHSIPGKICLAGGQLCFVLTLRDKKPTKEKDQTCSIQ